MTNVTDAYQELLDRVFRGYEEVNGRTGVRIRCASGPQHLSIEMDGRLPVPGNRRYHPHIAAAEAAWQVQGTKDPELILQYAPKLWEKFLSPGDMENGEPDQVVEAAYGHRWRYAFGRDQLWLALEALRDDPTNRQVWVQAWDPRSDGLGQSKLPNIPCPIGFSLTCEPEETTGAINMAVFIRSSDVFVGLPYDIMAYCLTLDMFAASLDRTPGTVTFTLAHAHLYEPHFEFAEQSLQLAPMGLKRAPIFRNHGPYLPAWTLDEVLCDPHGYVRTVKRQSSPARQKVTRHPFAPLPEVVV